MRKPSSVSEIQIKYNPFLCPPGFSAITLFGTVYTRFKELVEKPDEILRRHEMIHVRQAQSMNDSWINFYLKYFVKWIKNLPLIFINIKAPYKFISFELEAFSFQIDWKYQAEIAGGTSAWKKYEMALKRKIKEAKRYYNGDYLSFASFARTIECQS